MGEIRTSKLAAARRQLDAAIRMLFSGEDVLAVHTVASAATTILRDIAESRDLPLLKEVLENGLSAVYRDLI